MRGFADTEKRMAFILRTIGSRAVACLLAVAGLAAGMRADAGAAEAVSSGAFTGWAHGGSLFVLTTAEGADLPAKVSEDGFPLLVRLHKDFFDFTRAQAHGEDIRFSTAAGVPLAHQIEWWDPAGGTAGIWVRLPTVRGQERQEIRLHWGNATAVDESSGSAVFNESNGYLGVWHMNDPVKDASGALVSKDTGTTPSAGILGPCRRFDAGKGINCGEAITTYPTGSVSHSSEVWFRAVRPNATLVAWGNEKAQGKVVMQLASPPHIRMDCYFSDGNVRSGRPLDLSQWIHAVYTYRKGESRIYVNGTLDGVNTARGSPLAIQSPARMYIGGWHGQYNFAGDLDEVRVSKVERSAAWVKLQYENQKPMPTLVGPVVPAGDAFSVSPSQAVVLEGKTVTLKAEAGGAQKIYWVLKENGGERVVAVDRLSFTLDAGRVQGDTPLVLQFRAVCADTVKTRDIAVTVKEAIPDPVFTLKAPATWDGRETIEVVPQIANRAAMEAAGAGGLTCRWSVSDIATVRDAAPDRLILRRAQNSGAMTVTLALNNGGDDVTASTTIRVREPAKDIWVARTPDPDEKPEHDQFYARDDRNEGTLHCNGTLAEAAETVFLRLHADGRLIRTERITPGADNRYAFAVKLKPGLIRYSVECGSTKDGRETLLHSATNLVCGDAYLIDGQSNAVATDFGKDDHAFSNDWVRSFGSMGGNPGSARWGNAVRRGPADRWVAGYWAIDLAQRLVDNHKIPICLINGAVGGTRIDQHQRNPADPADRATIYGRLLWRVREARLTHGIRGILWHQGENDQGADGPDGGFGWETYRDYFIEMAAGWTRDYPNVRHYYLFQIWPKSCSMGIDGSDNRLREVQRTLPSCFSNLGIMSTLGIKPPGTCHYPAGGYADMARLIAPLVERDNYGVRFGKSVTPPDLKRAFYRDDKRMEIVLEFDQSMAWSPALAGQFHLDGRKDCVASGAVSGHTMVLTLKEASAAARITYLDSASWRVDNLLYGENGIAALTFCEVPILPGTPKP